MSDYDGRGGPPGAGTEPGQPAEKDKMAAEHEVSADLTAHYGVGDELRMRRESMGKSIADVADAVRIQRRYLEALEEGRLDHLPGTVYALGFVRTYAEHLGFSGPEMVARYKDQTAGLKAQSYAMPEPIDEGKAPTAAILLLAVLLAAVGYGVWYYFSQQDRHVAQQVPDVPARLAPVDEEPAATPPGPVAQPLEGTAAPSAPSEGDTPPPVAAPAPQPAAPAAAPAPQPAAPAAAPVVEAVPATPEPVAEAPAEAAAVTQPAPAQAPATAETVSEETPAAPPVEAEPREPQTYGLGNTDARIVITATEDAWLEVIDADEARLFSRVLRKGDSYRAPSREGAKFITGNAGGLRITVDGETAPSLGPSGEVRRNVKLDPDLLKAGKAWP